MKHKAKWCVWVAGPETRVEKGFIKEVKEKELKPDRVGKWLDPIESRISIVSVWYLIPERP